MPEKRSKCNILNLKVWKQFFLKTIRTNKKISPFGKGTVRWMFCICLCRNYLLWTFAATILWKTQPWDIFADYLQPNALQVPTMISLWKMITLFRSLIWIFFIPTLRHMFCSPNPSNIYGERDFLSWKNIHFCGL